MNKFAQWKMGLALWFGTLMFVFLGIVVLVSNISSDAKVAIAMAIATAFSSIIYAYWRKTSSEEKVNPDSANGNSLSPSGKSPTVSPPKANGRQATSIEDAVSAGYEVSDNVNYGTQAIPFDRASFLKEVYADVEHKYGEKNNCTVFYEAQDKILGVAAPWKFNNKQALKDAWQCVFDLAGNAFFQIWGATYEDAVKYIKDPAGCPTCTNTQACTFSDIDAKAHYMGMGYYTVLRDYRRVQRTLADLG